MIITPPLKKAPYEFHSLDELKKLIAQRGQFFGEDKSEDACKYRPDYPCGISLYKYWGMMGHNGLDIPCNDSEPILASHDGVVVETSSDESAGLGVVLWDDVQLVKTIYWHLKSFPVQVGNRVKRGDIIGLADNTGFSSGNNLHFGLKQTNQNGTTVNWENGFAGAVDPWPHLVWFNDMELIKLKDSKDIWLVKDGKRSLVYNVSAFQLIGGNIDQVKELTQDQFDITPDSGLVLAGIAQE